MKQQICVHTIAQILDSMVHQFDKVLYAKNGLSVWHACVCLTQFKALPCNAMTQCNMVCSIEAGYDSTNQAIQAKVPSHDNLTMCAALDHFIHWKYIVM